MTSLRDRLRATPAVTGTAPAFDPDQVPIEPTELLLAWLDDALASGVPEPHAVTLATVDAEGAPDARVLVLKDVSSAGELELASTAEAAKSRQLDGNPHAALSVYWPARARAIRVRGVAHRAPAADAAADLLARGPHSRALVLVGRQGEPLDDEAEHDRLVAEAVAAIEQDPELVSPSWILWRIAPSSYEFWQGDLGRDHARVRYERGADGWSHRRLWA
jgi:pyridoxamine 5'-phosphate oxidase